VTIVRPSHTYCERGVPTSVHGPKGSWQVLKQYILAHPELQQEEPEFDAWCDRVIQALEEAKTKI